VIPAARRLPGHVRLNMLLAHQRAAFGWARPSVRFAPSGTVLLLSPHLDDAVLNCWSVLTQAVDLRVVNVFTGAPRPGSLSDWDRRCGASSSVAQVYRRIAEDERVLRRLGLRPTNLPFEDIQYAARKLTRITMAALDRAVAEVVPSASLVYAPAALGEGHIDHRLVRTYARCLARAGIPVRFYADLPYAVRGGWPAWVSERRTPGPGDRGVPPVLRDATEVRVVVLGDAPAREKLDAMRGYTTQFAALDEDGCLSDPSTHRYEVFWCVDPTARET
jgi:LmbE family N-acetylglucosaminyl deacetylase